MVGALARAFDRNDRVRIAVDHRRGHLHLLQVFAKVGRAERVHARQCRMLRRLQAQGHRVAALGLRDLQRAVGRE